LTLFLGFQSLFVVMKTSEVSKCIYLLGNLLDIWKLAKPDEINDNSNFEKIS